MHVLPTAWAMDGFHALISFGSGLSPYEPNLTERIKDVPEHILPAETRDGCQIELLARVGELEMFALGIDRANRDRIFVGRREGDRVGRVVAGRSDHQALVLGGIRDRLAH